MGAPAGKCQRQRRAGAVGNVARALGRGAVQTVYANDNSKLACDWYERWHGHRPECCDVRDVQRLPASDYVCAGFPCVAFSRAGLQRGTKDRRGTQLFDETVRLLRTSPPRIGVVLENVPRLLATARVDTHHLREPRVSCAAPTTASSTPSTTCKATSAAV